MRLRRADVHLVYGQRAVAADSARRGRCLRIARAHKPTIGSSPLLDFHEVGQAYRGAVSDLNEHLRRVQDIADRAGGFQASEASDPKAFSKQVVDDLGTLAAAVTELIKRAQM